MIHNSDCDVFTQTTSYPVRKGYKYTVFVQSGRVSTRAIFHLRASRHRDRENRRIVITKIAAS